MIRMLCLALVLAPAAVSAQDFPALFDVTGVAGGDVLNIREQASARSPVIETLPPDTRGVEVVAQVGDWGAVNTGERVGYVSMTYLHRAAGPAWQSLDLPLGCSGTEPFWGLTWSPQSSEVNLSLPDAGTRSLPVTARWPQLPGSHLVGLGAAEGTVVLRATECSDGMSDHRYGLSADLFLSGEKPVHYTGCCSLAVK